MNQMEAYAAEFDRCAKWIESALSFSYGTFDLDDVRNAVLSGHMQLWPSENAALISEINRYPARTVCHIAFAGGNLEELRALKPVVMEWAKRQGCDLISVAGRKGWVRALGIGRIVSTIAIEDL
jgi:hypothetical protein